MRQTNLKPRLVRCLGARCNREEVRDDQDPRCACGARMYTVLTSPLTAQRVVTPRGKAPQYGLGL